MVTKSSPVRLSAPGRSGPGRGRRTMNSDAVVDRAQRHERLGRTRLHGRPVVGDCQQDRDLVRVGQFAGLEPVLDRLDESFELERAQKQRLGLGGGLFG